MPRRKKPHIGPDPADQAQYLYSAQFPHLRLLLCADEYRQLPDPFINRPAEEWRRLPRQLSRFSISNWGRIRDERLDIIVPWDPAPRICTYRFFSIGKRYAVHRLVAWGFCGLPEEQLFSEKGRTSQEILHVDHIFPRMPFWNNAINLQVCTAAENMALRKERTAAIKKSVPTGYVETACPLSLRRNRGSFCFADAERWDKYFDHGWRFRDSDIGRAYRMYKKS